MTHNAEVNEGHLPESIPSSASYDLRERRGAVERHDMVKWTTWGDMVGGEEVALVTESITQKKGAWSHGSSRAPGRHKEEDTSG